MGLFKKDMYKYELFERVKVNFDKEQQKPNVEIEKVFDNDDYNFYEYKAANEYSRYLVCQSKENPKMIYFLGNPASLICEFRNNLFLCGGCHEMGSEENLVHRIDLNNKTEYFYNLRDYGRMIWCNGYGRFFSTDNYTDMKVEDDELVIYGHREKGDDNDDDNLTDDVFNCEMDFKIIFRFENNQFVPYFEPIVEEHLKPISKQKTKPKSKQNKIVKEFTNKMIDFVKENNLEKELTTSDCEFYANIFNCIYELTKQIYSFDEILNIYDFFTDVLDGERPDIDIIDGEDAFKGLYRLSKRYSLTKKLEEQERLYLCYCIFQAKCIMKYNEETETLQFNRELFEEGPNSIVDKFEHELVEFPNKFTIKVLSDPTNEDYGFNIDNPIEVTGVAVEYQYLKGITYHGEDITFKHSFDYKGKYDNWVDSFDIFVDGEKITTLYFTSDGSYNSISCPKGFEFKESITENTNTTKNKDNEDDEYNNYALYLSENSNGIIDLNEAYNFIEVLNIYIEKGKNAALKEFDMLCKQIIKDSGPILSISKTSFLLGVLNSNQIIDEHEMNEQGEKYQEICLNLIMKDKK